MKTLQKVSVHTLKFQLAVTLVAFSLMCFVAESRAILAFYGDDPEGNIDAQGSAWPSFLGASRFGIQAESLPISWTPNENIAWTSTLVGHGQSSPVVWQQYCFVTAVDGPNKESQLVHCIDTQDGEVRWTRRFENTSPVQNTFMVSRAAPTPIVDQSRVVAFFESGDCMAIDHTGNVLWQRSLGKEYGPIEAEFGLGASLCHNKECVFVLMEHEGPSALVAISKASGDVLWATERPRGNSWSSPALFRIDDVEQVIVSSNGALQGYGVDTGEVLWRLEGTAGNTNVTPIDVSNGTFLIGASPGRQQERAESSKRSNGLVAVKKESTGWSARLVWHNEKLVPTWSSPISHAGYAYWVNRVGVVTCVDEETGAIVYSNRLKQTCWATPFAISNRIYFFGKEGLCTVISSGPEFQVLSENQLFEPDNVPAETTIPEKESDSARAQASSSVSGPTVYGFAVSGSMFLVRIGNQLYGVKKSF